MQIEKMDSVCENQDLLIAKAVCFQITLVGVKNMLVQAVPFLYENNALLNKTLFAIIGVVYLRAFFRISKSISRIAFGILCFVLFSFVTTLMVFPNNRVYILSELPRTIPFCFVTFFLLSRLHDVSVLESCMEKASIVLVFFSILSAVFIFHFGHITTSTWSTYSMPLSYVTMLAVMWLLHQYFIKERIRWLFFAGGGIFVILAYGSRNPLLAIASYIVISVIKRALFGSPRQKIKYTLVALVCCFLLFFWREALAIVIRVLEGVNITSRSLSLLAEKTLNTTGRTDIHNTLITALKKRPVLGYGVLGDRVVLASTNMEAHSLYLSILSNYGYLLGGFIIVLLLIWNITAYVRGSKTSQEILLIYICMVWPRGFTGGDVWISDVFWWLLGIVVSIIAYEKPLGVVRYD